MFLNKGNNSLAIYEHKSQVWLILIALIMMAVTITKPPMADFQAADTEYPFYRAADDEPALESAFYGSENLNAYTNGNGLPKWEAFYLNNKKITMEIGDQINLTAAPNSGLIHFFDVYESAIR